MKLLAKLIFLGTGIAMVVLGIMYIIQGFTNNEYNEIIADVLDKKFYVTLKLGINIILVFTGLVVFRCGRLTCGGPFFYVFMGLLLAACIWSISSFNNANELTTYLVLWAVAIAGYALLIVGSILKKAKKK